MEGSMAAIEPPKATYSITLDATLEGLAVSLQVSAESMNELRRAVRLLQANNFLVPQCPTHHRPMKQNSRGWYCSAKVGDGYCNEKVSN